MRFENAEELLRFYYGQYDQYDLQTFRTLEELIDEFGAENRDAGFFEGQHSMELD